jgi:glycosyltransferase involved in cell wall biosynthesis
MPRIAQVISIEGVRMGGAATLMLGLLKGGRERGWTQMVLNPFASTPEGIARYCEGVPYETLTPHRASALPRARRWLDRRLREFQPDIVHTHLLHAIVAVASLRRSRSRATVLTYHHHLHLQTQGRRWAVRLDRASCRRFDSVVASSEAGREFLLAEYGFEPSQVTCITNGWSGTPIRDPRRPEVPTVVSVANFRRQKRHDVLLDAFIRVRARMPDARLVLVGDGALLDETQALARRLGLNECVEFTGPTDVWPKLAGAHVFALSSDYEGQPFAVFEAMAAGLPVVATAVPGTTEAVRDGVSGKLSPRGDADALAESLTELLSDPRLRERMGEAARTLADQTTMERCVGRYFDLYENLLAR